MRNRCRAPELAAIALVATALVAPFPGCASRVDAAFDAREDFAGLHTWDFAQPGSRQVTAPEGREGVLQEQLTRRIVEALAGRGYLRGRERPDFRVGYRLSIEPRSETVSVPRAPYLLSSHSHSPSYWIEGSDTERRRFEQLELSIDVARQGGVVVWKAALRERLVEGRVPDLGSAVAALLERFPMALPRPDPPPRSADQLALR